ncbi:hypothetical protein V6N12_070639 [Hibiscus sabdariffa]|uniref:Uncharacterized protein n=1 Tax=Hibiscus sabdariffa TaxID=183260 RepID=A0ABR2FHF9_9ROSI
MEAILENGIQEPISLPLPLPSDATIGSWNLHAIVTREKEQDANNEHEGGALAKAVVRRRFGRLTTGSREWGWWLRLQRRRRHLLGSSRKEPRVTLLFSETMHVMSFVAYMGCRGVT